MNNSEMTQGETVLWKQTTRDAKTPSEDCVVINKPALLTY